MTAATSQPAATEYVYLSTHPEDTEQSALEMQKALIQIAHYSPHITCILCRPATSERTRRYDR